MTPALAPIVLFAFNRPTHLLRTLSSLAKNTLAAKSALTIFCDGPRNSKENEELLTDQVAKIAHDIQGFYSVDVICREHNYGCANAVISGLTEMFAVHDRLIVFEDDIVCSPHTLSYLNAGLERYEKFKTVFNIAAWSPPPKIFPISTDYPYDVYAIPRFNCWGWASWKDRFKCVDWNVSDYDIFSTTSILQNAFNTGGKDLSPMLSQQISGKINAWDIRMDYTRFKCGCVGINPVKSYTTNIGMGSGTHTTAPTTYWDNNLFFAVPVENDFRWIDHIFVDAVICKFYKKVYDYSEVTRKKNVLHKLTRWILKITGLLDYAKKIKKN